ncbi:MAG: hypothetical protein SNJ58_09230 [Aggregatilineales bacterium]
MKDLIALRLLRAVLWHIQSERSPVYRAVWRPSRFQMPIGWIYLLLLLSIPLLRLLEIGSGVPFFVYRDQALVVVGVFGAALISLMPYGLLSALTAAGIARLRLTQTWDMFLLAPAETYEVITAVTAAAARPQWRAILGSLLLNGLFSFGAAMIGVLGLVLRSEWLWAALLLVLCALPIYARLQEAALSLLIGRRLSYIAPRGAFVLGMMVGLTLRLALPVAALFLGGEAAGLGALSAAIVRLADVLPSNAALVGAALTIVMALLLGEFALIIFVPGPLSPFVALAVFMARSQLVRHLAAREEQVYR